MLNFLRQLSALMFYLSLILSLFFVDFLLIATVYYGFYFFLLFYVLWFRDDFFTISGLNYYSVFNERRISSKAVDYSLASFKSLLFFYGYWVESCFLFGVLNEGGFSSSESNKFVSFIMLETYFVNF